MNTIETLTVYLGSSGRGRDIFKNSATRMGALIAKHNKRLVYGGMDAGLMGALARSALENGAHVTGIIPRKIKDSERILPRLSKTLLVQELSDRKKDMFIMADAIIALAGGFGTLDEAMEVLYWAGLGLHTKPLVLVNTDGYWNTLIPYIHSLPDFDERFLVVVDTVEDALPALRTWGAPDNIPMPRHFPHFEDEIMRDTNRPIIIDKASVENTYFAVCALGLKQLGKHQRDIGFLNTPNKDGNGQFDGLLAWFEIAQRETFITDKCLKLYDVAEDLETLNRKLKNQPDVKIDLHAEKWGD